MAKVSKVSVIRQLHIATSSKSVFERT